MPFESLSAEALGNIYVGLLGLAVLLYAILDGYDLGVGVLFPPRNEQFKDDMVASIGGELTENQQPIAVRMRSARNAHDFRTDRMRP